MLLVMAAKKGRRPVADDGVQVSVRISGALVHRADAYAAALSARGAKSDRASVLRASIEAGLQALEGKGRGYLQMTEPEVKSALREHVKLAGVWGLSIRFEDPSLDDMRRGGYRVFLADHSKNSAAGPFNDPHDVDMAICGWHGSEIDGWDPTDPTRPIVRKRKGAR